ncbi:MAG: hypothetical protein ACPGJS_08095 [Flammeovirgaceae bacterium]
MAMQFPADAIAHIQSYGVPTQVRQTSQKRSILLVPTCQLAFHFIALPRNPFVDAQAFQQLTEAFNQQNIQLIHLWEDVWLHKKDIVHSRISSLLGKSQKVYARKTRVQRIDQVLLHQFLEANHLEGATKAKFKYGLFEGNQLLAVASFAAMRTMNQKGANYRSGELIRFCNKSGMTVVGGFSKLLHAFIQDRHPNDIMTYVNRDWANGNSYLKLGFKLESLTPPLPLWLHPKEGKRYLEAKLLKKLNHQPDPHQTIPEFLHSKGFINVYTSGNLKLRKALSPQVQSH